MSLFVQVLFAFSLFNEIHALFSVLFVQPLIQVISEFKLGYCTIHIIFSTVNLEHGT